MKTVAEKWLSATSICQLTPPLSHLFQQFRLDRFTHFPGPEGLQRIANAFHKDTWTGPAFKGQATFVQDERYYETIISEDNAVPTREDNWHDLFNALVWIQFPHTKRWLNQLHVNDIEREGAHPRTPARNRITHFDECGVVLAVPEDKLEQGNRVLSALATHSWKAAFWDNHNLWCHDIFPVVFGHANLEMLLSPFIGLTGKWLAVKVCADYDMMTEEEKVGHVDRQLCRRIQALDDFQKEELLRPLPLLGVPGWHVSQSAAFYDNRAYFRPQRAGTPGTIQLPLK